MSQIQLAVLVLSSSSSLWIAQLSLTRGHFLQKTDVYTKKLAKTPMCFYFHLLPPLSHKHLHRTAQKMHVFPLFRTPLQYITHVHTSIGGALSNYLGLFEQAPEIH